MVGKWIKMDRRDCIPSFVAVTLWSMPQATSNFLATTSLLLSTYPAVEGHLQRPSFPQASSENFLCRSQLGSDIGDGATHSFAFPSLLYCMRSSCPIIFPSNIANSFVRDPGVNVQRLEEGVNTLKNAQDIMACHNIPHNLSA
jgi:hypothetical protein